jgi:hypothetical protein
MAKRKQKVTEETLVYLNDLADTIDLLAEDLAEVSDLLGLNELKVGNPDKFEGTLNDAVSFIFQGHSNLQQKLIPMLEVKRAKKAMAAAAEIPAPQPATTCAYDTGRGVCGHALVNGRCRFVNHNKGNA